MKAAALSHWWRGATAPLLALSAVKLAVHLATNGNYGFHRDELYYIASGQHPALGYVDYPPVTPLLARLDTSLFGTSPAALRVVPAVVGALLVVLTGLCAREMGGGHGTQALAAFVALVCPLLLGANWLFQTVTFDQLTWLIAMYLVRRLLKSNSASVWVALGLDLGIGFETKFTILALCAGIVAATLSSG
jgi:4-amino-4-deoxy-L-arabinose transferase-like glycosyltransferase